MFFSLLKSKLLEQTLTTNELYYLNLLKNKEKTLKNNTNVANELFLEIAKNYLIKVESAYKELPIFISKVLKDTKDFVSNEEQEKFLNLKKSILEVKLFLFQNIENNIEEFKEFENKIFPFLDKNDELNSKILALSFYEFKFSNKNYTLESLSNEKTILLVNKTKNFISSNYFDNFLPNEKELQIIKETTKDIKFYTGLEYEFLIDKEYIKELNNISTNNEREVLKNIINNLFEDNKEGDYNTFKVILENVKEYKNKMKNNYLEIISKKFNSTSEMLIFNDIVLKILQEIKAKSNDSIIYPYEKSVFDNIDTKKTFDRLQGSIHLNVSLPNIENFNKIKFILFLKESELMNDWEIRNNRVKDLSKLVDIFGPYVLETSLVDKYWQVNFEYIDKNDKEDKKSSRIEIRYIGGKDYELKSDLINENIKNLLNYVKIATTNQENDLYLKFLKKYEISKEFKELEADERNFLKNSFNLNDEQLVIFFNNIKDITHEYKTNNKNYIVNSEKSNYEKHIDKMNSILNNVIKIKKI